MGGVYMAGSMEMKSEARSEHHPNQNCASQRSDFQGVPRKTGVKNIFKPSGKAYETLCRELSFIPDLSERPELLRASW